MQENERVRIKLQQPDILCEGRTRVKFHARGRVKDTLDYYATIRFKYQGKDTFAVYNMLGEFFLDTRFRDLKVYKWK